MRQLAFGGIVDNYIVLNGWKKRGKLRKWSIWNRHYNIVSTFQCNEIFIIGSLKYFFRIQDKTLRLLLLTSQEFPRNHGLRFFSIRCCKWSPIILKHSINCFYPTGVQLIMYYLLFLCPDHMLHFD